MVRHKVRVDFRGIDEVEDALGHNARRRLNRHLANDIEEGTRDTAEQASDNAPVDTGALRASIVASVRREGKMNFIFGSHLPYAQLQEYEHVPYGAYFRKAIWQETPKIGDKIGFTVRRSLRQ